MHKSLLILLALFATLETNTLEAKQLPAANDTLILKTEKQKGYGLFQGGYAKLHLDTIAADDDRRKLIPEGISDPKSGHEYIDFKVWHYNNLKNNYPENINGFLKKCYPAKIDTANLPSFADNTVKVIVGTKDGDPVYIVDENNNRDFRDDPVRLLKSMYSEGSAPEPVKCRYLIYDGKELVRDSGWVLVALGGDGNTWISATQHVRSTFSLDHQKYEIQCVNGPPYVRFCFESPMISITAQSGVKKDSLLFSEQLELGEYLKFGKCYYRFADVANDGSTITLIREADVSDKIGTQPGFIAPDFSAVTTEGDSIALSDYRDQYLLLVNVTACWSKIMSYDYYQALWNNHHTRMAIVAIDESPGVLQANIDALGLKGKFIISTDNSSVKRTYREDYCSRVCFLIDPGGHIVDRFEIFDWQESLAKHFR